MYGLLVSKNIFANPNQPLDSFFNLIFMNLAGFKESVYLKADDRKKIGLSIETSSDQKSACGVEIAVVWNSLNLFVTHLTLNARSTRFRGDYAPKQIDTEPDVNNEVRVINIGGIPR